MNNMLNGNSNNSIGNFNFNNNNMYAPHYEIIQVNGEAGAKNIRMGPNSSCLLLDNSAPIIWLATTDGAGYLTVIPYDFFPHQAQQPVDVNLLAQRVSRLEETINARQSNTRAIKQSKKQQSIAIESTGDTEC